MASLILRIGTPKQYRDTVKGIIMLGAAAAEDEVIFNTLKERIVASSIDKDQAVV